MSCEFRLVGFRRTSRASVSIYLYAAVMSLWLCTLPIAAQSVYFSGVTETVNGTFTNPTDVALDSSGNVYISDSGAGTVSEILASNGSQNTLASGLSFPIGVAVDSNRNVYTADYGDGTVREIQASNGEVITLATGYANPAGIGVDGSGNVYFSAFSANSVYEILAVDGSIPASPTISPLGGGFNGPEGVGVDRTGNVYVADYGDATVREMTPGCSSSACVKTLSGGFNKPEGVAVDVSGNVFVGDAHNNSLSELLAVNGSIPSSPTIISLGSGFSHPIGVAVDATGNVFVANYGGPSVLKVVTAGVNFGAVEIGSASPPSLSLQFTFTAGGTIKAPVALTQGASALDFSSSTTGTSPCASGTYSTGQSCNVNVTFNPSLSGTRYGAVQLLNGSGAAIATGFVYGTGEGPQVTFEPPGAQPSLGSGFVQPGGTAVDGKGNVYVADPGNNAVDEVTPGCLSSSCVTSLGGGFSSPSGVAVDGAGNVYVADSGNNAVKELPPGCVRSSCVTTLASSFKSPSGVAVDGSGNVYIADTSNNAAKEILTVNGSIPATPTIETLSSAFIGPLGVAVDGSGNVYVADTGNNAVKELLAVNGSIPASPTINALGGSSSFSGPSGVAVGGNGNVYVADTGHGTMDGLTPGCASSICVTTLGGSFNAPFGVAVDGSGNVYVGDSTSAKVVELELSAAPTLNFGTVKATTASSPQSVTVSNIGNTDMSLAAAFDATSQADGTFTLDGTSSCSASTGSLTAGTDCTYAVDFSPISGTSYSGTLTLTDDDDNSPSPYATQTINLNGTGESIVFVTSSLASGTVGVALTPQTLKVSGGSGTYTFAATGLPAGLSLSSAGTLSGTPTAGGTFGSIQVTATDSSTGVNAVQTYSMTIASATITLATASLPNATYNSSYSHGLPAASGGTAPYSYNLFSGSLPPGLSVDSSTGVISGTPAQGGSYPNFVIQVTDSSTGTGPYSTTQTYSLTVDLANQATLTVNVSSPAVYNTQQTLTTMGGSGTGTVTYSVGASTACSVTGATLSITSGSGSCSVTAIKAADSNYNSEASAAANVTVQPVLAIVNSLPIASAITYGQMLSVSTLTGGSATPSAGSFQWVTPSAVPLAGTQSESAIFVPTDTADYSSSAPVSVNVSVNPASFIVTVNSDDSGTASNCTPQTTPGHGTDASCSLRDALLDAAVAKAGNITFDATAFGTAKTITLANGSLILPSATTVAGTTAGSGTSLANLVTVDGNGASAVFTVSSGVTGTTIANLVIRHGNNAGIQNAGALALTGDSIVSNTATGSGGGINNSGGLTLSSSTISGNTAGGSGGGISNSGTLTLSYDTIAGNNASTSGGGIYNTSTLAVSDSTLSGNAAVTASGGGGIDNMGAGTTTLANDLVSGNTSNGAADDFDGVAYTDNGGNIFGVVNGAAANASAIDLAPLGSYGGPTQTLIPLPGSAAICSGLTAEIPFGLTTDQRGLPNTNGSYPNYSTCVDAGAVQTNYALSFTTQPTGVSVATNFTAAVKLTESGSPFQPTVTIPLTLTGAGTLSGGSVATANGIASYTLQVNAAGSSDMLTANLVLNGALAPPVAVSATSNTFAVGTTTTTITLGLSSTSITYGTEETLTATLPSAATGTVTFYNNGSTILGTGTVSGGTASFSSSTLTAGFYLITAAYSGDSNYSPATTTAQSLTVKQATATITWSPAATISYGTSLASELNASAAYQNQNVAGTFSYTAQPTGGTAAAVTGATILPTGTYTLATSFTPSDLTDYNTVTDSVAITVSLAKLTLTANNATRVYGVANPGFTGSVTGAVNGDTFTESFSTTATIASNVGSYSIVPSAAGANIADYSVAIQNGTLTISQAGTTTALGASSVSITPGQSVTLTAQVTSATSGTPTGSVNFYDGTTLLDTATLSAGLGSFTTSALSPGTTHQLSAEYNGDINFTSSSTSQFTPIVVAGLDFSLSSAAPTGQTVKSGSAATYQVAVVPLYGTYPGPMTFTATGLPTGAVASFSPANIPANGGQQTVTVTIQTAATSAALQQAPMSRRIRVPIALALLLLPLVGARRLRRQGQKFSRALSMLLLLLGMATFALSGCVSHTNFTSHSTYTVTITASSGNLQHSTNVTLTVQ